MTKGSSTAAKALIAADQFGVAVAGASGMIANFGTISGGLNTYGVDLADGGIVTNGRNGSAVGRSTEGVAVRDGAGTLTNSGTITGGYVPFPPVNVTLVDGGTIDMFHDTFFATLIIESEMGGSCSLPRTLRSRRRE